MTTDDQAMTEARRIIREAFPVGSARMVRGEVLGRTEHSVRVQVAVVVTLEVPTMELIATSATPEPPMTRRQARDLAMARLLAGEVDR